MKNRILIIILTAIFLITLIFILVPKNINIEDSKELWTIYDNNIENIKNNLDTITIPNEYFYWWELKDFDIEDEAYKSSLNRLLAHIRMCYLELTDDGTLYTLSNPIRQYRDKTKISKKELKILGHNMQHEYNQGCIRNFNDFSGMLISDNDEDTNRLLAQINKLNSFKETNPYNDNLTYNELLINKVIETSILEDLSEYIVLEYNLLK